jgi:hypothetical protein
MNSQEEKQEEIRLEEIHVPLLEETQQNQEATSIPRNEHRIESEEEDEEESEVNDQTSEGENATTTERPSNSEQTLRERLESPEARRKFKMWTVSYLFVNVMLIIGLVINREGKDCETIRSWAMVEVALQFLLVICNFIVHVVFSRISSANFRKLALIYLTTRLTNVLWIGWNCTGIVWTFQSLRCWKTIPILYSTCFSLAIVHLAMFGIPLLLSCCSIPFLLLVMLCCPQHFRQRPSGLSLSKIKKLTRSKKFEPGMIPPEDSSCSICLSDYQQGEELRYLPCNHVFHSECILPWLKTNKTCPMCKAEIDKPIQNTRPIPPTSADPSIQQV